MQVNQNILSYDYDSQFNTHFERPYSESSISCCIPKMELKCLRDPIASRVTLVSIFTFLFIVSILT